MDQEKDQIQQDLTEESADTEVLAAEADVVDPDVDVSGTELEAFESEEIEEKEFVEEERIVSIVESILFSTEKPQSVAVLKQAFKGTNVTAKHIRRAIDRLMVEYAGAERGVTIEEVNGGFQLRTKSDNMEYLKRMVKARPFKLSGPALEVLSIVAYKQPCAKIQVDEVRGVESGHLVRGLMEKNLLAFAGKSELPGKPMLYKTTKKFLEIFGLRNVDELPSLSEIDELIPEGMDPEEAENKESLGDVADGMAKDAITSYSAASDELEKIASTLEDINTSSDFFEQEKAREKAKRDAERAQEIQERLLVGEDVDPKDQRWLERYDAKINEQQQSEAEAAEVAELLDDEAVAGEQVDQLLSEESPEKDGNEGDSSELEDDFSTIMHMDEDNSEPDPIA